MSTFTVTVPATTANLGPGFDCIGAALTLYNRFTFTVLPDSWEKPLTIRVTGAEASQVSLGADNLLYRSFLQVYQHLNRLPPSIALEIEPAVPLSRGLGSSATAIVGGLVGANHCAGAPLSPTEIRDLAIALEGHPDNVVPALFGHCQLSTGYSTHWEICQVNWQENILPVVAIPDFELSTEKARAVLPKEISRQDAIFNVSRLGLLLKGLETGNGDWLRMALEDRIHQPYRKSLIPGYDAVRAAAIASGAFGLVISGAGPTLLAPATPETATTVATAMENAWRSLGVTARALVLSLDTFGARIGD
jgi:homoserine kinase